jgi:TetR/AcrR family tetracycline transcriptional repressor
VARRDLKDVAGRTNLTREVIVEGALALADSEGLGAVTIRRLAGELGVTPMALYWHFRSKDELLDGMADRIYAGIDVTVGAGATWQEQFRVLMGSVAGVLRAHPSVAILHSTRNTLSESSLRGTEVALDILRRGGFSPVEATQIARHALITVSSLVNGEPGTRAGEESGELMDVQRRTRVFLEALPPDRYPRLVEAAAPLSRCDDPDAYYEFGLDLLLAGIEAMAARSR